MEVGYFYSLPISQLAVDDRKLCSVTWLLKVSPEIDPGGVLAAVVI
jgi:hypothetical protein